MLDVTHHNTIIRYNYARADRVSPCTRLYRRIRYPVIYRIYSETGPLTLREKPHSVRRQRSGDADLKARTITAVAEHAADALFVAAPCPSCEYAGEVRLRGPRCAPASSQLYGRPRPRPPERRSTDYAVSSPHTRRRVRLRDESRSVLGPASLDLPGDAWRYDPPAVYFGLMRSSHTR